MSCDFNEICNFRIFCNFFVSLQITINRPERRNAFRPKTVTELKRAFDLARDDTQVGVIIFTGKVLRCSSFTFCWLCHFLESVAIILIVLLFCFRVYLLMILR